MVLQEFLETGVYVNRLDLLGGALRTSLRAEARPSRPDRLDLVFGDVQFQLGPLKFTQARFGGVAFPRSATVAAWRLRTAGSAGHAQPDEHRGPVSSVDARSALSRCHPGRML